MIVDDFSLAAVSTVDVGTFPTGLAYHDGTLAVALSGSPADREPPSLVNLSVDESGALTLVEGASAVLSDAEMTKPTDVVFTAGGRFAVVADTMTNLLSVFPVADDRTFSAAVATTSAGIGPFGTAVTAGNLLVVTETQGGPTMGGGGKASISTYTVGDDGALTVVANQVTNLRIAACWASVTPDGSEAITSNTADGTVSAFALADDGAATLASSIAAQQATTLAPRSAPIDSTITPDGRYFYQLWGGLGVVTGYEIGADGTLAPVDGGIGGGLPQLGSQGIVVV